MHRISDVLLALAIGLTFAGLWFEHRNRALSAIFVMVGVGAVCSLLTVELHARRAASPGPAGPAPTASEASAASAASPPPTRHLETGGSPRR